MAVSNKYIELTVIIEPEDGQFTALCKELNVASCGNTFDEALRNVKDAIKVHLETLEEIGERARVFKERGISIRYKQIPNEPLRKRIDVSVRPGQFLSRHLILV